MAKKNLPNIPLYIGDWEKDCNVLSLECEAAWLRIIFKMFTNGKQSTYKIPTKGLQNIWRVSDLKVQEIIEELIDNNICDIKIDGRFTEFTSRRFKKENELSETRKDAVSNRYNDTNDLQNFYKTYTKDIQITDIENNIEIVNETDNKNEIVFKDDGCKNFKNSEAIEVLEFLNQIAETAYRKVDSNLKFINARLKEGLSVDDLKKIVQVKAMEWKNDPKMSNYLRPETLFNATKCQAYHQQVLTIEKNPQKFINHVTEKARTDQRRNYDPLDYMDADGKYRRPDS